ncbi:hypothetical protein ABPG72_020885 [Tetrahymena utriculariae]
MIKSNRNQKFKILAIVLGLCCINLAYASQILLTNQEGQAVQIELQNHNGNSVVLESSGDNAFQVSKDNEMVVSYTQIENQNEIDNTKIDVVGTLNSNYDLKVEGDLHIAQMSNSIFYKSQKQWKLFAFDDFQYDKKGWSEQAISSCGSSENIFLGGHCNFGGIIVTKEYTDLPPNSFVNVKFNIHFFDDWTGELAFAQINGVTMWQQSYAWCNKLLVQQCKNQGISACGKETPDTFAYPVSFTFQAKGNSFILGVGSNLSKNSCDASWGIDDVSVYIN